MVPRFPLLRNRATLASILNGVLRCDCNLPRLLVAIAVCVPALAFAAKPKPCVTASQAAQMLNKDICVSAHIYEVVQLPDGTRFLDVCSPQTPDEQCRFTVVS